MKTREVTALDTRLERFLEEMTASLGRKDRRRWARAYVTGLLLDGERKSIEPMAARLGEHGGSTQSLQQFVSQSPWACETIQAEMARHAAGLWPEAQAWILDETSFPKAGLHSVGVARQYCGALGKIANCQVAVSLHYAGDTARAQRGSAALGWRLLLPREWCEDAERRKEAGVPAGVAYRSKNRLALELLEEALARGVPPAPVLADSDYGDDYSFRSRLRELGLSYCVAVEARAKAWTQPPVGSPPPAAGRSQPANPLPVPQSLGQIARSLPARAWRTLSWRRGTRGPMRGRFACVPVWASHGYTQRQHMAGRACEWLVIEWPKESDKPTDYWLAHLCKKQAPSRVELVGLARGRWPIEQDYRELKEELGLDHFEGRGWLGWHHHVTLVGLAHLFLQRERLHRVEPEPRERGTQKKSAEDAQARVEFANSAAGSPWVANPACALMRPLSVVRNPLRGHLVVT